jgi:hypothetical protein
MGETGSGEKYACTMCTQGRHPIRAYINSGMGIVELQEGKRSQNC